MSKSIKDTAEKIADFHEKAAVLCEKTRDNLLANGQNESVADHMHKLSIAMLSIGGLNALYHSGTTVSDLKKDPEKLEQFYKETRAEQQKKAETERSEQIKAATQKAKAAAEELKNLQEPVKITSATRPSNFVQFNVRTMV